MFCVILGISGFCILDDDLYFFYFGVVRCVGFLWLFNENLVDDDKVILIWEILFLVIFWSFLFYFFVLSFSLDFIDLLLFDFFDSVGLDKVNILGGVGIFLNEMRMLNG